MSEQSRKLNILVLFAGAGLATRGLLDAGHTCTDVEIIPEKSHLSKILNPEATHLIADVLTLDATWIASFDAVWSSPPCQKRSKGSTTANFERYEGYDDLLLHSLVLSNDVLWVENVFEGKGNDKWGSRYNAAQFMERPIQNRQRLIGGRYRTPGTYRQFEMSYLKHGWNISTAVTASMWHRLRDTYFRDGTCEDIYGYVPTLDEVARLQGIDAIPLSWYDPIDGYSWTQWQRNLYEAIGNGVPVYMARAFGEAYSKPDVGIRQLPLFELLAVS
jgi:site-specific DNA-cytosine methylase